MSDLVVRTAEKGDLAALNDLYNSYVVHTPITFDVEPVTMEDREEWFSHFGTGGRHRLVVAVLAANVAGYASSKAWRPKRAYETSVETTVYVADGLGRRGIGTALYRALFDELAGEDVHRAYAGITMPNAASVALHERFGFRRVAYYSEQGRKFGKYWDVAWYEKPLG